ncbi:MAG TPA: transketolase C-terminal domain-containing protein, partial [Solirubrobacteraceae bacterium]
LATRGWRPVVATFGAFLTRAHDVIRMAALSGVSMTLVGSHPGTEIGRDGGSQMALEDLAMMRAIDGSTVVSPADGNATAALLATLLDRDGIGYLRSTRGAYPVLYEPGEAFPLGGSKQPVHHGDDVCLAGTGATVHAAIAAAHALRDRGIGARVLDVYSLAPLDPAPLVEAARATGGRLVIVEDHRPEGGLAGAMLEALALAGPCLRVARLAVSGAPGSGEPHEVMDAMRIGPAAIAAAADALLDTEGR